MIKQNELEWETTYQASTSRHKNIYPSELVVGFVRQNYNNKLDKDTIQCLDIGCGWGNNLYFLKQEGFCCHGIDLSKTAIKHLKRDFGNNVHCGDAQNLPYKNNFLDFVIDRASIMHNRREDITLIFSEIHRVLKPGGKLFSIMRKIGNDDFLVTKFSEPELKKELSIFNIFEINYSSFTKNHGRDIFSVYVIEAQK